MKLYLLSAWTFCVLAVSLFAGQSSQAQGVAPSHLAVRGASAPIGANVLLYWGSVPAATAYNVYRDGAFLASSSVTRFVDYAVTGGETHVYRVSSIVAGSESSQSVPAKALVPPGGNRVIYADALENAWASWGWANLNFANYAPARGGRSISIVAGPWQAMYLHHAPMDTTPYAALTFWVDGGNGGQKLMLRALRSGAPQAAVPLDPLPSNGWRQVTISLSALGVAGAPDLDGFWLQDASGTTQPRFFLDEIALVPASAVPPAPAGLKAAPKWMSTCKQSTGTAMPHIDLSWNNDPGAVYYTVYRDGAPVQAGVTNSSWSDMDVTSGQTYSYAVSATGTGGQGPLCAPVSATAPMPTGGTLLVPPANVSISGLWEGAAANVLSWQAVPGAAAYNVYVSDVKVASGLTGTSFTISPTMLWGGAIYTVTSVDGTGMESIPSAPTGYLFAYDPTAPPSWANYVPDTPDTLAAAPEWNQGGPRILLTWRGRATAKSYNVYRDGVKVVSSLWRPYYLDSNLSPGETHTYTVTSLNTDWPATVESAASAPVSATALETPPPPGGKVVITKVVPNDDSAVVFFTPVPGATDYRIYDAHNPAKVKYAGRITNQVRATPAPARTPIGIEWNGIDPVAGADLVVEAVDKFGPFQRMDGAAGSGAMNMSTMNGEAINGQGDPSDVPVALAQSDPFHVTCVPAALTGGQVFFDNFRGENPLTVQPIPARIGFTPYYGDPNNYAVFANDKWEIRQYGADLTNSQLFFMGNHFMDTTYDGGGPTSSDPAHNNIASMVMVPKATADISGGKVLHVTFEVDAHFDSRRWCELMIGEAGDPLIDPAKFDNFGTIPTVSGKLLRWQIQDEMHQMQVFLGDGNFTGVDLMQFSDFADSQTAARVMWDHVGPFANGTEQDLDKRHRFDLYLSKTHYRLQETTPDGLYNVLREKDFPAGVSLPFDKCQVYFVHQVYHTSNDRMELMEWYPYDSYWYTQRPHSDERHWDNVGEEVLPAFPALPGS